MGKKSVITKAGKQADSEGTALGTQTHVGSFKNAPLGIQPTPDDSSDPISRYHKDLSRFLGRTTGKVSLGYKMSKSLLVSKLLSFQNLPTYPALHQRPTCQNHLEHIRITNAHQPLKSKQETFSMPSEVYSCKNCGTEVSSTQPKCPSCDKAPA